MDATGNLIPVSKLQQKRSGWVKNKKGDAIGSGFLMPKGDFAAFLGWKPETEAEKSGKKPVSGSRAIEIAIRKQIDTLGKQATRNGELYRNMYISHGRFENEPGRERDLVESGLDSIKESVELGHAMGIRYLEMQYKFQLAFKNFGTISNLMKTRHESVKKSISEVR